MSLHHEQGTASAAPTFDAAAWLSTFATIGGGYALTSDRRVAFIVGGICADDLTVMMAEIVGHRDRQDALRDTIERRQSGELHP